MRENFITYEQALALKELGLDEPCIAFYSEQILTFHTHGIDPHFIFKKNSELWGSPSAPLKSQVFKWFREEHGIWVTFEYDDCDCVEANVCWYVGKCFRYGIGPLFLTNELNDFKTYEEAESACIDKLISIIKEKKS
jgi:hypothetical protein